MVPTFVLNLTCRQGQGKFEEIKKAQGENSSCLPAFAAPATIVVLSETSLLCIPHQAFSSGKIFENLYARKTSEKLGGWPCLWGWV